MSTLMQAHHNWAHRPADERFTNLLDMQAHFALVRSQSREIVTSNRQFEARPVIDGSAGTIDHKGLEIVSASGHAYAPTNWAFGQLAQLAEAPAGYLRTIPSSLAADCINYGLKIKRNVEDVGLLLQKNGSSVLRAATGPRYGRIWNEDIVNGLVKRFGDGITGDFRVPGEFGERVDVTSDNTTLYASDRDMFVFLADEENRIEIANRRDGKTGTMARGFFIWNSEVGDKTFGVATFLFDYVCCNRIVWGAGEYKEIKIRHTSGAPDRWVEEIAPALKTYAQSSTRAITDAVAAAQAARIDNVDDFLAKRFGKRTVAVLQDIHKLEEGRPIETLWDVTTAVTARARSVKYQDERVEMERAGGAILDLVAA